MKKFAFLFIAVSVTSACSVTPDPFSVEQLTDRKNELLSEYTADQEPVTRPISLYEAMARAIKYNLDYKVELFGEALASSESQLANLDMLPDLTLSAGLTDRSNYSGSRSSELLGANEVGDISLVPSTSSEKDVLSGSLELSWDILDFGLSYVRAKQRADEVLIANERKRKVANRIIEDVREAYWRAVSAERLVEKLASLEADIASALTAADESYRQRRTAPLAALTYQRELLDIQREMNSLNNDLLVAKRQLASLMNIGPTTDFTLVLPQRDPSVVALNFDAERMVNVALLNRPEIREIGYEQRITQNEATSALLDLLPNLNLFGGFNYNSNEFLFSNEWAAWGAQASWNALNLFRYPAQKRSNSHEQELVRQRALALTMAVVTQVHVGASRYEVARQRLETQRKYFEVSSNILEQIESGYKTRKVSFQNFVREKMNSIVAEAQYDIALADLQNAYGVVFASIGQDTFGDVDTREVSVTELAEHLQGHWEMLSEQFTAP